MKSIHRSISGQSFSINDASPYCNQVAYGTNTPASPQPGAPGWSLLPSIRSGEIFENAPSAVCASGTSSMNLCENASISKLYEPVRQNAPASPIHPMRSSRCGQSVGIERKLPRCPHRPSWLILLRSSLELSKRIEGEAGRLFNTSPCKVDSGGFPL